MMVFQNTEYVGSVAVNDKNLQQQSVASSISWLLFPIFLLTMAISFINVPLFVYQLIGPIASLCIILCIIANFEFEWVHYINNFNYKWFWRNNKLDLSKLILINDFNSEEFDKFLNDINDDSWCINKCNLKITNTKIYPMKFVLSFCNYEDMVRCKLLIM